MVRWRTSGSSVSKRHAAGVVGVVVGDFGALVVEEHAAVGLVEAERHFGVLLVGAVADAEEAAALEARVEEVEVHALVEVRLGSERVGVVVVGLMSPNTCAVTIRVPPCLMRPLPADAAIVARRRRTDNQPAVTTDARRIFAAQAFRAFAYGFASVLLGVSLAEQGWSPARVSALLTGVIVGMAVATIFVGTYGDRIGRRRTYAVLFAGLAAIGVVFAFSDSFWLLISAALVGTLSTDVVESGPFTTLEQSMLAQGVPADGRARVFATYNAIATVAGSFGALAAGGPALLRDSITWVPSDQRLFLVLVPAALAGLIMGMALSPKVEPDQGGIRRAAPLGKSRSNVMRLASLFAVDAFGGGFVVQSFIAYWFSVKFDVSVEAIGALFFAVGLLQTASFMAATRIASRIGLLNTMVFTHLPSNVLLASIAFAPSLGAAIALLLGRVALSQMDVPTRQAYVANLVTAEERTAAVGYTNSVRYAARPAGAALAGVAQQAAIGLPFAIGGSIKIFYDIALWLWFRTVRLEDDGVKEEQTMKWVTRARPKTDRIACPWLIKRFIDPTAEIAYVPPAEVLVVAARDGARSFDAPEAEFGHRGNLCTFEVLIEEFALGGDAALRRLARIVHAADIEGEQGTDPLGPGLLAIGLGSLEAEADDDRLLEKELFVYDALYEWCKKYV